MAPCFSLSRRSASPEFQSTSPQTYLSIGSFDVLLGHTLQEHLLSHEVGRLFALLAIVETHFVDLT